MSMNGWRGAGVPAPNSNWCNIYDEAQVVISNKLEYGIIFGEKLAWRIHRN